MSHFYLPCVVEKIYMWDSQNKMSLIPFFYHFGPQLKNIYEC
jgi:hypothetical protein